MAVTNSYNALGRGASIKSSDFIVPGSNVSVDPNPQTLIMNEGASGGRSEILL